MNCPHCGAEHIEDMSGYVEFSCGTLMVEPEKFRRTHQCVQGSLERQISQLKAELAQSVRRDDSRLKAVVDELERSSNGCLGNMEGAVGEDFILWEQLHCDFASRRDQLQSIISGK